MENCKQWLSEFLSGQVFENCDRVRRAAAAKGFTKRQLHAARKELGVTVVNDSALHDGEAKNWFWLIPREVNP